MQIFFMIITYCVIPGRPEVATGLPLIEQPHDSDIVQEMRSPFHLLLADQFWRERMRSVQASRKIFFILRGIDTK